MTAPRRASSAIALVAVALLGAGCGGDEPDEAATTTTRPPDTVAVETESGTQGIEADDGGGTFFFETDAGSGQLSFDLDGDGVVAEGEGGRFELAPGLPSGWPGDFPLPDGAVVRGGNVLDAGALRQLTAVFDVAAAPPDVLAFYEQRLADHTAYADVRRADPASYDASFSFDGSWVGFVSIQTGGPGAVLAVQLHREG